ncbi:MAG: elongation factor P, partial [Collinsella sp.]|nr:elongation factor P [Collinsella sp.]
MPTISTADFKNGLGLRIKDKVYTIVEFQHVKPGKGGAFVRYKTRDIKSGRVV